MNVTLFGTPDSADLADKFEASSSAVVLHGRPKESRIRFADLQQRTPPAPEASSTAMVLHRRPKESRMRFANLQQGTPPAGAPTPPPSKVGTQVKKQSPIAPTRTLRSAMKKKKKDA